MGDSFKMEKTGEQWLSHVMKSRITNNGTNIMCLLMWYIEKDTAALGAYLHSDHQEADKIEGHSET